MLIAVLNQSSVITNEDIKSMVKAVNKQMILHVSTAWNQLPPKIEFYSDMKSIPGYAWVIRMMDNPEQALALNYSYKMGGKVNGFVFCKNVLDNGGVIFGEGEKTSICSILSQEIIELFVDRFASQWANGLISEFGSQYALEACDPVEGNLYNMEICTTTTSGYFPVVNGKTIKNADNTLNCSVSNFIFPSWLNTDARENNFPYDYLKTLVASFKMSEGGCLIMRGGASGTMNYVYSSNYPDWKKDIKIKFGRRNFQL